MSEHRAAAIEHMQEATRDIESAQRAVDEGHYEDAAKIAQRARDHLYYVEIELRKATVVRLTHKQSKQPERVA